MITPLDIQNKEFKKSFRGYSSKSVDGFLDDIIEDYERIYKENIELKDKINLLTDQIRQFNTLEETLKNTLIIAQTTADEVTTSARNKANLILEDAELSGKKILDNAKEEVRKINSEYERLKNEMFTFKTRYQSFIQAQLISLEDFYKEIEKKDDMTIYNENTNDEDVIVASNNIDESIISNV